MREMLKGKIGSNFISAFMCSIDITTGIVTSACAGHHPMIILRKRWRSGICKTQR
jgi:serine phosphatase RsbU (regulator of sigma subunit)